MDTLKPEPPLDPLRRVFVPVEKRNLDGSWSFSIDGREYRRDGETGVIRRRFPKINGKLAKKMRRQRNLP